MLMYTPTMTKHYVLKYAGEGLVADTECECSLDVDHLPVGQD